MVSSSITSWSQKVETGTVPVFEEATDAEGNEFEHCFQHKHGGEEVVAVFQGKIQRLQRESKKGACVCVCINNGVEWVNSCISKLEFVQLCVS